MLERIPLRFSGKLLAGSTIGALTECQELLRTKMQVMDRPVITGIEDSLLCYCMVHKVDSYAATRKHNLIQST